MRCEIKTCKLYIILQRLFHQLKLSRRKQYMLRIRLLDFNSLKDRTTNLLLIHRV